MLARNRWAKTRNKLAAACSDFELDQANHRGFRTARVPLAIKVDLSLDTQGWDDGFGSNSR